MKNFKKYFFIALTLFVFACSPKPENEPTTNNINQEDILNAYAEELIVPAYNNFQTNLNNLESSVKSTTDITELRSKFNSLYLSWQACAFYDFGPSSSQLLPNNINIYPADVDQIEININNNISDLSPSSYADQKGLPALDYLLFERDNLSTKDSVYLLKIISEMQTRIAPVVEQWNGNFKTTFVSNTGTDNGSSLSFLINGYIKYYERDFRDGKLGIPLGRRNFSTQLPDKAEAIYSDKSNELLQKSLENLKQAFYGNNSNNGMNALITESCGIEEDIRTRWERIETSLAKINTPVEDYVLSNKEDANTAYEDIQELLVYLKVEYTSCIDVKINYVDTDGD